MTLREFLEQHRNLLGWPDRVWLELEGLQVYVRYGRCVQRMWNKALVRTLELANIEVRRDLRGRGVFTQWLETEAEPAADQLGIHLFVESVLEPRFQAFWERRGYRLHPLYDQGAPCYMREPGELHAQDR